VAELASDLLPLDPAALSATDRPVFDWLTARFGMPPVKFYRQLRWRIGWEAEVETGGETRMVYVRGNRGDDFVGPISMRQEAGVQEVMARHGVLAARVYGVIDDPLAVVMEKLPGRINTDRIAAEAVRSSVRRQFIEALVKLHNIPVAEFGALGLPVPATARDIAFNLYGPCIDIVREKLRGRPFGLVEFFARWLERNVPSERTRPGFVTGDAGQFLYDGDRFTGLIDFEVAYIGDPAAEFAGMRLRNTTEPLGDISKLCDYYEELTGDRISKRVIEYHSAGFASTNSMLMWPMMFSPDAKTDYVAYLQFTIATSRWGLQGMAEAQGVKLEPVPEPTANPGHFAAAPPLLTALLQGMDTQDGELRHRLNAAAVLAGYVQRCAAFGGSVLAADIADTIALTGEKVETREAADIAVDAFVRRADGAQDATLIRFFHRWLQRQNFLLRGCGSQSYLTETNLQYIPPRAADIIAKSA
jgi:aminoglycoside phosphotransferase (APT) family kinase protein